MISQVKSVSGGEAEVLTSHTHKKKRKVYVHLWEQTGRATGPLSWPCPWESPWSSRWLCSLLFVHSIAYLINKFQAGWGHVIFIMDWSPCMAYTWTFGTTLLQIYLWIAKTTKEGFAVEDMGLSPMVKCMKWTHLICVSNTHTVCLSYKLNRIVLISVIISTVLCLWWSLCIILVKFALEILYVSIWYGIY